MADNRRYSVNVSDNERMASTCYDMGMLTTPQYDIIMRALRTEGITVTHQKTSVGKDGARVEWTITCAGEIS